LNHRPRHLRLVRRPIRMLVGISQRKVPPPLPCTRRRRLHLLHLLLVVVGSRHHYPAIVRTYVVLRHTRIDLQLLGLLLMLLLVLGTVQIVLGLAKFKFLARGRWLAA